MTSRQDGGMQGGEGPEGWQPTREDVLVGRVTDHEASPADWAEIEALAQRDPGVWVRLAQAQRAHARLSAAVDDHIAVAELVELPVHEESAAPRLVAGRLGAAGGWAAAAAIALVWAWSASQSAAMRPGSDERASDQHLAGVFGELMGRRTTDADGLYEDYLRAGMANGSVVTELPAVYVEAQPRAGGGHEVLVLRRQLVRYSATDLQTLRVVMDDSGQPVVVVGGAPEVHRPAVETGGAAAQPTPRSTSVPEVY